MTGLREELDICAIAHQIEIKNAFLIDRLSNTLYTSSNCNTEIGAQQNKKNTTAAIIDRLSFTWPRQLPCELFHFTKRERKSPPQSKRFS